MPNFRPGYTNQGQPLGMTVKEVSLVADNTRVDCGGISLLKLSSNSATATDRTFILNYSNLAGHALTLYFVSGSSYSCELADSGTVKLQGAWTPLQYDTLQLVSDGTVWVEVARSSQSGVPELPLTAGSIYLGDAAGFAAEVPVAGYARYVGEKTTVGGAASEDFTVTGLLTADFVMATLKTAGSTPRTILSSKAQSANTMRVVFSGDPAADHVITFVAFRAST